MMTLIFIPIGLILGLGLGLLGYWLHKRQLIHEAQAEAHEITDAIESETRILNAELEELLEEEKEKSRVRFAPISKDLNRKITRAKDHSDELKELLETAQSEQKKRNKRRKEGLKNRERRLEMRAEKSAELKNKFQALTQNYIEKLLPQSQVERETLKAELASQMEVEVQTSAQKWAQVSEDELQFNLDREAKRYIQIALNRFARPYCPERGIGNISFKDLKHLQSVLGSERERLTEVEKICGVDITVSEEYASANVLGFDPVRREIGRLTLEKLARHKQPAKVKIEDLFQQAKRQALSKIASDGKKLLRELRLQNMSPAIVNMMGALRYRYSFAQNQYFHCTEVGWLCGVLSAELGLNLKDGRRAGLLHDIGKAMDHSKDGGHAVIGAEFIEQNNEKPEIVHAVRAHHFDEQPSTDLAYLVIASDALSGARPGARRSTVDSYTQKMADLEKIGTSFPEVTAAYILSAGREVRVIVNSKKVDDQSALTLSQKVAKKIEEECSYPGLIRVTVVRKTQAVEYAR